MPINDQHIIRALPSPCDQIRLTRRVLLYFTPVYCVIRIIHRNIGLKRFFHLPKFLLLSIAFAYIYISQGSVETH